MSNKAKGLAIAAGLGTLAFLVGRRKGRAGKLLPPTGEKRKHGAPMKLSENFNLSEFVKPPNPKGSKLTDTELRNAKLLTGQVLQPARDKFGPLLVSGGFRLLSTMTPEGWVSYLRKKGHTTASMTSDHFEARGADIFPAIARKDPAKFLEMVRFLAKLPATRQVIAYYRTDKKTGETVPGHIHVAVRTPERGKISGQNYALMYRDNKLFPGGYQAIMG